MRISIVIAACMLIWLTGCAAGPGANTPADRSGAAESNLTAAPDDASAPPPAGQDGIAPASEADDQEEPSPPPEEQATPEQMIDTIVSLLQAQDLAGVAEYAHPEDGIRFSPYGHIDPDNDVRLTAAEIAAIMDDSTPRLWGSFDGSGEPIELAFADYYAKFIYDKDYAAAEQISYNEFIGQGNTLNNLTDIHPDGFFAEFHFPGTETYAGMDWSSLRIVLEPFAGEWFCSAIIHDQWTI